MPKRSKFQVKMWLIDSGCGHDLVSRAEIAGVKHLVRRASKPLVFNTADGKAPANDSVNIFVKELGEEVSPSVLEQPLRHFRSGCVA